MDRWPEIPSDKTSVFLSYSHQPVTDRAFVQAVADVLASEPDIFVVYDRYDLYAGRDAPYFMEQQRRCQRTIIVVTPEYVEKATERTHGVGFETCIITSALATDQSQDTFLPILRRGDNLPIFLQSKWYVDFRDPRPFGEGMHELLSAIRRKAAVPRPRHATGKTTTQSRPQHGHRHPIAATLPPQNVTTAAATLRGQHDGHITRSWFEFGATPDLGYSVPAINGSGIAHALQPKTTYYFRYVAQNEFGTTFGDISAFTTAAHNE